MHTKWGSTLVVILFLSSVSIAQTYVVGQKQAKEFGDIITNAKLLGGWRISAIDAKKDHIVVKCQSPNQGEVAIGFYHLSDKAGFEAKTTKFGLRVLSGTPGKGLVKELAAIVRKGDSGFKWVPTSAPEAPANDHQLIKKLMKAREHYAFGEKQDAVKLVDEVEKEARTPGVIAQAARYYMDFGIQDKGRRAFDRAIGIVQKRMKENPSNPHVTAEAISVYAMAGDIKKAEDLYWTLMSNHKEPMDGKQCLAGKSGAAMASAKKDDLALKFYHRVLKRFPNCKQVYLNAMYIEAKHKNFKEIDKLAEQALKRWPNDQDVLFTWGNVYHVSGKFKRAEDIFIKLAAINPRYPTLLSLLGGSLINLGKSDERLEYLKRQVKLHPDNLGWYYGLGAVYFYRKNYEKARIYMERTAKLAPNEARPKIYLALSLYWLGHRKAARKLLESINNLAYKDPDVFFCQAIVWSDVDKKRSLKDMQKFMNILDNEPTRVQWGNKRARAHKILEELKHGKINAILMEGKPEKEKKKRHFLPWIIGIGLLVIFGGWGYVLFRPKKSTKDP